MIRKLLFIFFLSFIFSNSYAMDNKQFLKEALLYGFDMNTTDYTKYMSKDYLVHIDGKTFTFEQWQHHMVGLKALMKSYTLTFDDMISEGDKVATSYLVHAVKKDGTSLDIHIIALFTIKDNKLIYCNELTRLVNGDQKDKNLASQD